MDRRHVSFMYSYPNYIPLPAGAVRRAVAAVEPYAFDRIYGFMFDLAIERDAKAAVARSAERYLRAIGADGVRAMTAVPTRRRPPLVWLALIAVVVLLGLGSRRFAPHLPGFVAAYAGDTLWATAAFLGIGLLLPRASTGRVALLAMSLSVLVEVGQLYHAPWIDSIRSTTLGGLVLGYDFVWSDLACYAVGVVLGILIEQMALLRRAAPGT